MFQAVISVIISYLLGSIPFAILITGIVKGVDVRDYGSKNAGATNVYRVAGLPTALTVALLDLAKGFAAVFWIATLFSSNGPPSPLQLQIICALAAIGGHMFTLFAGFKGGKGVLTAAGAFLALMPLEVGLAFVLFLIVLILTRYVSLGSISAALFLSLFIFFEKFIGINVPEGLPEKIVLRFKNNSGKYIQTQPMHSSQKLIRESGGEHDFSFHLCINWELIGKVLSWQDNLEVLSPDGFREKIKATIGSMAKTY